MFVDRMMEIRSPLEGLSADKPTALLDITERLQGGVQVAAGPSPSTPPASAKAKGRRAQQTARDAILAAFPALAPDDVRSASMGANGEDILLSTLARSFVPFSNECKARARAWADLHQGLAQAASQGTHAPLLVVKADRKPPLAVLPLDALLVLLAGAGGRRPPPA